MKHHRLAFLVCAVAFLGPRVCSGQDSYSHRVADLNPGPVGSFPSNMTVFGGGLYFSAYTFPIGRELWRYDGHSIALATNINDTADDIGGGLLEGNDSVPQWLTPFEGALYFSAFDPRRGGELWRFDGTNAFRAADINPDADDTIKFNPNNSWPSELTVFGGALYFSANTGAFLPNYELWKYQDGTATMVTNIHSDLGSDHSSYPHGFTAFGGALYFMADDGLNGYELWRHDGLQTVLLSNLNPGAASSFPKFFQPFKDHLYFQAIDDAYGFELWRTDGSAVTRVTDIHSGTNSSFPEFLTVFQDALYFRASNSAVGSELWKFDGTNAALASDINPAGDSFPRNLTVFGDQLCFAANDGVNGWELWRFDGATASLVTNLNTAGDSFPEAFTLFSGALYFIATTPETGYEWWKYDGEKVSLAADILPGPENSYPQFPAVFERELAFSATEDGFSNWELWTIGIAELNITSIEIQGPNIALSWNSVGGATNIVQVSGLVTGPFTNLSSVVVPGSGPSAATFIDTNGVGTDARFYRIARP